VKSPVRWTICRTGAILLVVLFVPRVLAAQHVNIWGGGGIGAFLSGGSHDPNGHKFLAGSVSLFSDRFRVRYIQGSLERSKDLPPGTGDNDMDYFGFDFVFTRNLTGWPVDLAAGVARFEEAYPEGYPDQELGGSAFVHRWGPHVSAFRAFNIWKFIEVWGESDFHYIPYQPRQFVVLIDAGIGAHF
jgi:hypothetical protein